MDEGDDYVPQMSQLGGDYGQMGMGAPSAPQAYGGMSGGLQPMTSPYEQQMMLIGQPPQQQQPPQPAAPPPKTTKRGSKKKEALDPMQSMAAMSSNPMMRSSMQQMPHNMYSGQGQMGMYGQGGAPQQSPHYAQGPYRGQQYPQQQGYPGMQGYPQRGGYPPTQGAQNQHANGYSGYPPQQQYPQAPQQYQGMRPQYQPGPGPGQQQMPPGQYWDQSQFYGGSGNHPMHQHPPTSNQHPSQTDWMSQAQHQIYQIELDMRRIENHLQQLYNQPRNQILEQEIVMAQRRYQLAQGEHSRLMHLTSQGYPQQMQSQQQAHMNQQMQSTPSSMQQTNTQSQATPNQAMVSIQHQTPIPSNTPVQVTQSGAQVQVNIKPPEVGRTTINVIHQFGNETTPSVASTHQPQPSTSDDTKDSVPPEPTPTHMMQQPQVNHQMQQQAHEMQMQQMQQQCPPQQYSQQQQQSYQQMSQQQQIQQSSNQNGVNNCYMQQPMGNVEVNGDSQVHISQSNNIYSSYQQNESCSTQSFEQTQQEQVEQPISEQKSESFSIKQEMIPSSTETETREQNEPTYSEETQEQILDTKPQMEDAQENHTENEPTNEVSSIPTSVFENSNIATPPMYTNAEEEIKESSEQSVEDKIQEEETKSESEKLMEVEETLQEEQPSIEMSKDDEEEEENDEDDEEDQLIVDEADIPSTSEKVMDEPEEEVQPSCSHSPKEENVEVEEEKSPEDSVKMDDKEPTPSEVADSIDEASTEASTPAPAPSPLVKKAAKRPSAPRVQRNKKEKYYDSGDDDDDFVPEKKKGGKRSKKPAVFEDDEKPSTKWGAEVGDDEFGEDSILTTDSQDTANPDALICEKILNSKQEDEQEESFLVKWKGKAYMHCEWKTAKELEEIDKRSGGKIKRFKSKRATQGPDPDDEDFNPDYLLIDRIVDVITGEDGQEYALVKWKSLAYDEVTWEPVSEIAKEYEEKIDLWRTRQRLDKAKIKDKVRPKAEEWQKLSEDMVWKDGNSLREYQFEGVDWLLYCYYTEQNCILADEMGLGKTVQTITFLSQVYEYGIHGPFLIVVPLSTIHNWVREFETWTDMNAVVYHGSAHSREVLQQYEIYYSKEHSGSNKAWRKNMVKLDALITTFEMVVSDVEFLKKINWRVCVIDEAHRLKNRNCKLLTSGLYSFKMEHRVLLTGTPLQNNIEELFSLLNFLHPLQFSNSAEFLAEFGQCQTDDQVQKLQEILKPMMLRRLKEDVEKSLQPKQETIIEVQLSDTQKKYYRAILERNFTHLCKGATVPSLNNIMMELRKCCNHPFLIQGAEETILSEMRQAHPEWDDETLYHKALVQSAGKVVLIEKLLPKLRKDGHKVLVFSQMVKVLDLLEEFLQAMNYPYERIDGNVRGDIRQASIDRFSKKDSDRFVFLLCTRAGGLGINLTAADTVIIFDSDWNPQNDLQAQARCHRIGQTKTVKVYRLVTSNTYEREMFDKASLKLGLDKAVLQSTTALKESSTTLSKKDIEDLLKKGAYGSIMDENNEGSKFSEEDIETILQRRTTTITLEAGQKGSLFSKATFNSTHNKGDDIDIDDPNFWMKWAAKAQVDVEKVTATPDGRELIIQEPRKRTKRFEDNSLKEGEESDGSEESLTNGKGSRKRGATGQQSQRKRRRGEDDDGDYVNYRPDELAFNKSEYFKVEKYLASWGWGRWAQIKKAGDLEVSEMDIMHMSRTLLLHCVREFRGDDRVRRSVWNLILPQGAKVSSNKNNMYNEGWAVLPEYNPPNFALDATFQRHIHRHANKLMGKIDQLSHLQKEILGNEMDKIEENKNWSEMDIQVPQVTDTLCEGWDSDCDKCLLIGVHKHGFDGLEQARTDENLVFVSKAIEPFPIQNDLIARFRRLIGVSQRTINDPVANQPKWNRREEQEFMRVLRSFGMKDKANDSAIDWDAFRAFSPVLTTKSNEELQEYLYCVLAMCTRVQGGELSGPDLKRAQFVETLPLKRAQKLMGRLHLTRKVHTLVSGGLDKHETTLKLCSTEAMPTGWGVQHDKELLLVCDEHGIDNISSNILNRTPFQKIIRPTEKTLLRRVIEVCTTLETNKWNGPGNVDSIEDSDTEERIRVANTSRNRSSRKRGAAADDQKMRAMLQQSMLGMNEQAMAAAVLQAAMLNPSMLAGGNNNPATAQLIAAMLAGSMAGTSASTSSSNSQQQAAMAALVALAAASQTAQAASTATTSIGASTSKATPSTSSTPVETKSTSSAASQQLSAQQQMVAAELMAKEMGISVADLVILASLPPETRIPVRHIETKEYLTGDAMPRLKNLTDWLSKHPKYRVDLTGGQSTSTSKSADKPSTSAAPISIAAHTSDSTPASAKPSAPPTPKSATPRPPSKAPTPAQTPKPASPKLEPGEVKKSACTSSATPSATATVSSSVNESPVAVFNRQTGALFPVADWPSLSQLPGWLDTHPEANIHSNCINESVLKTIGSGYLERLGGDTQLAAASSSKAEKSLSQGTSALSASTSAAVDASKAASAAQLQEMLQLQMILQMHQMQQMQSTMLGFNPYAMAGASTSQKADDMNPLLMAQLMTNPLALQAMLMDPVSAAALSQMSAAAGSTPSSSSSKKPKQPPSSSS